MQTIYKDIEQVSTKVKTKTISMTDNKHKTELDIK